MRIKYCFVSAFLLLNFYSLFSQRGGLTGGSIGISFTGQPAQHFKDSIGSFGNQILGLNLNIPLFSNRKKLKENLVQGKLDHFYEISGHASFETQQPVIGLLSQQRNFYNGNAGIAAVFQSGKKNIILTNLSLGIASDALVLQNSNQTIRFAGSFIVNHFQNPSLTYQYGLVLSYAFGRPLLLPVLGLRKKFAKTWTASFILPVSLQVTDRLNKNMSIGFFARPSGNRFQVQNQQQFNTNSSTVYMQLRQFELGGSYWYRFARNFSVGAEAGLLAGGRLKFTDPSDYKTVLSQAAVKPGGKFRISLRYYLPHKKPAPGNMDNTEGDLLRMN